MKKLILLTIACFLVLGAVPKEAYLIYTGQGKKSNYDKMLKAMNDADIVFFGELHNNTISHWLELEVGIELLEKRKDLVVGCEMFEADDQEWIDQYFAGKIDRDTFEKKTRIWPNYKTDYRPMVEYFKEHNIPLIATNIPRRFARMVSRGGMEALDTLTDREKAWMAPLPIEIDFELPSYKSMIDMMAGHIGSLDPKDFVRAQALKDATMAYFTLKHLKEGVPFYHFNGAYHSDSYEGIVWWIRQQRPDLKIVTVSTREYPDISSFRNEDKGIADFVVYVPERMTHTY